MRAWLGLFQCFDPASAQANLIIMSNRWKLAKIRIGNISPFMEKWEELAR